MQLLLMKDCMALQIAERGTLQARAPCLCFEIREKTKAPNFTDDATSAADASARSRCDTRAVITLWSMVEPEDVNDSSSLNDVSV